VIGVNREQIELCEKNEVSGINKTDNREELTMWYSACDVFFNPSVEETFGLVTAEAMACGAPVILYNSTASPELVKNTDNYCVEPHNLDDVVECIKDIVKNGKEKYQNNNINKIVTMYDQAKQYQKYVDLYKNILVSCK